MDKRAKILVVDDEPEFLNSIKELLTSELNAKVYTAENADDGFHLAEQELPSLILSDYYMPEEDGFSFCTKVKTNKALSDIPFLMLTSASELSYLVKGFEIGADDYITKPFHTDELISRIRAHLRVRSLREELKRDKSELEKLNKELQTGLFGAIDLLTQLIGLRVPNAASRSRRAADIMDWIAKKLDLTDEEIQYAVIAARLHEIGKIHLSDKILQKEPHLLNEMELRAIDQFPVFGHLIVSTIPRLGAVATYLRYQMENYDGTGYPDRLFMDEIPLPSRVLRGVNLIEEADSQTENTTEYLINLVQKKRSTILDPKVSQLLAEYIRNVDSEYWEDNKQQIALFELQEGMVIAEDICTGSGVKLLNKDSSITLPIIERLLSHNGVDPILNTIYIYKG